MKKLFVGFLTSVKQLHNFAVLATRSTPQGDMLNIVFEQRNKAYGAYALRRSYNQNMGKSLFLSIAGLSLLFALTGYTPTDLVELDKSDRTGPIVTIVEKNKIKIIAEPQLKAANPIKAKTIAYLPPKVVPNETVIDKEPVTNQQLLETGAAITQVTHDGETGTANLLPNIGEPGLGTVVLEEPKVPALEVEIFDIAEVAAEFVGGEKALMDFIQRNIRYPSVAQETGIHGRVYVQFVVETDGSVSQLKIVKEIGGGCGSEAVRVLKKMPNWSPATQNGRKVRCRFTVPVLFKLV